jgi:hypothetical protein
MSRSLILILILLLAGGSAMSSQDDEYLVGVYYFAGWWRESPNKWAPHGPDWRADYPERVPILGQYNEQRTMDREIIAASSHGVDFFQILWYPGGGKLNEGLRTFMASPESRRMKFTVEYVNHPPFDLPTDADWEAACREWCAAMKHPSYLRVGGRPVFKVHGLDYFHRQNGDDPARVKARLDTLRRIAKECGLPNPLISGGVGAGGLASGPRITPYDFLTTYMEMPNLPQKPELYPYEALIKYAEDGWLRYAEKSEKPYVPYVPSGWDPRPWKDPRPSFAMPNREEWIDALRRVKSALDSHPDLGIPVKGGRQKAFLIYAWNEFGEGGIVAPTRGEKDMKLEAIREVFAR